MSDDELMTTRQFLSKVDWEGGLGEYVVGYASKHSVDDYELPQPFREAFYTAYDSMQALREEFNLLEAGEDEEDED